MFLIEIPTFLLFIYMVYMFVFIHESIPAVLIGPGGSGSAEISISAVTYIQYNILIPYLFDLRKTKIRNSSKSIKLISCKGI